jgi:hypothetical protein
MLSSFTKATGELLPALAAVPSADDLERSFAANFVPNRDRYLRGCERPIAMFDLPFAVSMKCSRTRD